MSVPPLGSDSIQSAGAQILQQLLAKDSGSQSIPALSAGLGDGFDLSPAALQLTQPSNGGPQGLADLLAELQGGAATYTQAGNVGSNQALITALMKSKNNLSETRALLNALTATLGQDPLLASLGSSEDNPGAGSLSLFG